MPEGAAATTQLEDGCTIAPVLLQHTPGHIEHPTLAHHNLINMNLEDFAELALSFSQLITTENLDNDLTILDEPVLSQDFVLPPDQMVMEPTQFDIGQNSVAWTSFLNGFGSANKYARIIDLFVEFRNTLINTGALHDDLVLFFDHYHALKGPEQEQLYKGTTLRGWLSVFKAFFKFVRREDICQLSPIIEANLRKWESTDRITKAAVFTKENLRKYPFMQCLMHKC